MLSFLAFSFTPSQTPVPLTPNEKNTVFKTYHVMLTQSSVVNGCTITVSIMISFDWDGPLSKIKNVTAHIPTATVNCGGTTYSTSTGFARLDISSLTGNITDMDFDLTGNTTLDNAMSDPTFKNEIKVSVNDDIDAQK